jgi:NifU-like protein involved in Fe-S cluster formation
MKYNEATRRHFETAERAGVLTGEGVYRGAAGSRKQGTWVQFDVRVRHGVLEAARFLAFACPHTIAAADWVAEHAEGPLVRAALPVSVQELSDRFAVPLEKRGRLLIVEDAWMATLSAALQR